MSEKKKSIVEESQKTRRVREKLVKYWADMEKYMTEEALQETTVEIHQWIARHASDRISLKSKNISLFDENQNAAKLSKKIAEFAEQINGDFKPDRIHE